MEKSHYMTKQKKLLLETIKKNNCEFRIKDLEEKTHVGLTTVYRFIEEYEKLGLIKKLVLNGEIFYEYFEKCEFDNHFYLKCLNCGKMIHIDCNCIDELRNHINLMHQFSMNMDGIMITGICDQCRK